MMVKIIIRPIAIAAYFLPFFCLAQVSSTPLVAVRTNESINLDGILNEAAWSSAVVVSDFLQALPNVGGEPTEFTEVKIMYDDVNLYVGIMAYDSFPDLIVARGMERDVYYGNDDYIGLILDTYNDKRQAIGFFTNALSARFEEEFISNGASFNPAYNTFWNVKSRINEKGFAVEFQIPFSSLRFEQKEETIMEFKITRYIRRKNEFNIYPRADPNTFNLIWSVNTGQEIMFRNLKAKRPLYLIPFARLTYQDQTDFNQANLQSVKKTEFASRNNFSSDATLDKVISNIGMDLKYGITKNFTLDATINTDFAQAEADNRVINLTRFNVNLPEKRGFFLESSDYMEFATPQTQIFNSRNIGREMGYIVPILGGVRLTGKSNGYQIGVFDIQTLGLSQTTVVPQNFGLFRVRKELFGDGSFLGAIVTNRVSTARESINNQGFGIDFVKRYGNKWMTGFNAVTSNDVRKPGLFNRSSNLSAFLFKTGNLGFTHNTLVEYAGTNFKPGMGFAPDSGYVFGSIYNEYRWQIKNIKKLNQLRLSSLINNKWREANNTMESITVTVEAGLFFKNGIMISFSPFYRREYVPYDWQFAKNIVIPRNYYSLNGYTLIFNGKQTGILSSNVSISATDYYGGHAWTVTGNLSYSLNKHFTVRANGEFNFIKFPKEYLNSHYNTTLVSTGLVYTQSAYFSIRLFTQYDNLSNTIGTNLRLRFNPKEGTDLYLVYSPRINTSFPSAIEGEARTMIDRQVIILKFSKALSL